MLVIGVESESSNKHTIERSSVEGPSQILTSIKEEEKMSVLNVFDEGKSPQQKFFFFSETDTELFY